MELSCGVRGKGRSAAGAGDLGLIWRTDGGGQIEHWLAI